MEVQGIYGTQTTFYFPLIKTAVTDFAVTADYTPAAADARYMIDGGTDTQCTNTIALEGGTKWSLTLTAAEMSGTRIIVTIVDAATKAIEDQCLIITTQLGPQLEATKGTPICEVETAQAAASNTTCEAHMLAPTTTIEQTADHYSGRLMLFTTGILTGEMTRITDYAYTNSNMALTFEALANAEVPGDADRFVIL